jgi:ABC-type lipoprotein export system ATPase subunit
MNKLSLLSISKIFDQGDKKLKVFQDISFEFLEGKSYAITGISGSGKSTLIALLAGLEVPTFGKIFFNEKDIYDLIRENPKNFFGNLIGVVFQTPHLIRELSVIENVMISGLIFKLDYKECVEKAKSLLDRLNLISKADVFPAVLSLGEQQRVAIARALFQKPVFLLVDEPTAHLDKENRDLVVDLLTDYQSNLSTGLIVSCHDPFVANCMDKCLEINEGTLKVI